jgi:uncharacterized protein HemX
METNEQTVAPEPSAAPAAPAAPAQKNSGGGTGFRVLAILLIVVALGASSSDLKTRVRGPSPSRA